MGSSASSASAAAAAPSQQLVLAKGRTPWRAANSVIRQFAVTTDSVVATVDLVTDADVRRITISWGDGTSNTRVISSVPVDTQTPLSSAPLPAGTFRFQHPYDPPTPRFGQPFTRLIIVGIQQRGGLQEFSSLMATLTPRYRVNHYETYINLAEPADPFGSTAEFEITMFVDDQEVGSAHWYPLQAGIFGGGLIGGSFIPIGGSAIAREFAVGDEPVSCQFLFIDSDDWSSDDEARSYQSLSVAGTDVVDLSPSNRRFSETKTQSINGAGTIKIRYDRDVTLLVPLTPGAGGPVVQVLARA
jgi:hypothetical protein